MQVNCQHFKRYNTSHQSSHHNAQLHRRHFLRLRIYHRCGIGIVLEGKCGVLQNAKTILNRSFYQNLLTAISLVFMIPALTLSITPIHFADTARVGTSTENLLVTAIRLAFRPVRL